MPIPHDITVAQKVEYLQTAAAYPHGPPSVEVIETHMAWVFLAGDEVFKLKKPVRYPYLDFSTLAARQRACEEEVRLNARLAPTVYRGVVALRRDATGRLQLGDDGVIVDWLVRMRRLPAPLMLDAAIGGATVTEADVEALGRHLGAFYRQAAPVLVPPDVYLARIAAEHERNRSMITRPGFALDTVRAAGILTRLDRLLSDVRPVLRSRVASGAIVEGHGDLRPEHICLERPPVIIDCIEFNEELRQVDPWDELAYVGLECERLGAGWIGQRLLVSLSRFLESPPAILVTLYRASRALLRARLALAHLTEPDARTPAVWEPLARTYLDLAARILDADEAAQ